MGTHVSDYYDGLEGFTLSVTTRWQDAWVRRMLSETVDVRMIEKHMGH